MNQQEHDSLFDLWGAVNRLPSETRPRLVSASITMPSGTYYLTPRTFDETICILRGPTTDGDHFTVHVGPAGSLRPLDDVGRLMVITDADIYHMRVLTESGTHTCRGTAE